MNSMMPPPCLLRTAIRSLFALVWIAFLCMASCEKSKKPCPCQCIDPPARVTDLSAEQADSSTVRLLWTAPHDDCDDTEVYDVRYSTEPREAPNWWADRTEHVLHALVPRSAGSPETLLVSDLNAGPTYYFALQSIDRAANPSELSNTASITLESAR